MKYTGKIKNITTFINEVIAESYMIKLQLKYSKIPEIPEENRTINFTSSIEEFKQNVKKPTLNIRDNSHNQYDPCYDIIIDYIGKEGWHFLWCYLSKKQFFEIVEKYNLKPV